MKRVVVSGGAGFLGSHLCKSLVKRGDSVICLDNLSTGSLLNLLALKDKKSFEFIKHDVSEVIKIDGPVDAIVHFASPAAANDFERILLQKKNLPTVATQNMLELANLKSARFMLASTGEVAGAPKDILATEAYRDGFNHLDAPGTYLETKCYDETLASAYMQLYGLSITIARIFNTYGPHMRNDDGHVISSFIYKALKSEPLVVYGDGSQTRSFCYVDDQISGQLKLLDSNICSPINLGASEEWSVLELANRVIEITNSNSYITFVDPIRCSVASRCPDISQAKQMLKWEPLIDLRQGLIMTVDNFRNLI